MSAYMIVYATIHDREKFLNGYAPAAAKLVQQFGGEYVVRAAGAEVLEGDLQPGMSVVISRWPDKAAIHAFWDSAEYQQAKTLREGVCDCEVVIVESAAS